MKIVLNLLIIYIIVHPQQAQAIPPPEIINNFGSLFIVIFNIIFFTASTLFFIFIKHIKQIFKTKTKIIIFFMVFIILTTSTIFLYSKNKRIDEQKIIFKEPDSHEKINNINKPLDISAKEFSKIFKENNNLVVIDVRFPEEYKFGHVKNAIFWSFKNANSSTTLMELASNINENDLVVFYCIEGYRSKLVATEFAKYHKKTNFVYGWAMLEEDIWEGDIFNNTLQEGLILNKKQSLKKIKDGEIIVDPRSKQEWEQYHLAGSINIPVENINHEETKTMVEDLINGHNFIAVCYDKISCFKAHILQYRMNAENLDNMQGIYPSTKEDDKDLASHLTTTPEPVPSH